MADDNDNRIVNGGERGVKDSVRNKKKGEKERKKSAMKKVEGDLKYASGEKMGQREGKDGWGARLKERKSVYRGDVRGEGRKKGNIKVKKKRGGEKKLRRR